MAVEDFLPCAILIPSLGRPHRLKDVVDNLYENTKLPFDIHFMVNGIKSKKILDELQMPYEDDSEATDHRYVTRMNKLVRDVDGYKTVFFGSDDVVHHRLWLESALEEMERQQKAVIVVNDLRNPSGTQALVRTDYFPFLVHDDPSVAFHPGYQHNYADTEMFLTAEKYKQLGRAFESKVEHLHPIYQNQTSRPWDDTYRNAMSHWHEDAKLFADRIESLHGEDTPTVDRKVSAIARLWGG